MTAPQAGEAQLSRLERSDGSSSSGLNSGPLSAPGTRTLSPAGPGSDGGGGVSAAGGMTTTTMYRYTATSSAEEVHVTQTTLHAAAASSPAARSPSAAGSDSAGRARAASRFHFVSDTRAPSELQRLERETLRRRQEFKEKVRDMEYKIAAWTARLANETLARDREWEDLVQRAAGRRLEESVERIMDRIDKKLVSPIASSARSSSDGGSSDDDDDASNKIALPQFEARVSRLDAALLDHVHKVTYDARVSHLDSLRARIRDETYPLLRLEAVKADKREGGMVRTFEGIAASAAHAMAEENAARVADFQMLEDELAKEGDEKHINDFLQEIQRMREVLEEERKERQLSDEKVLENIIATREVLQRTVLESLGEA